MPQSHKVRSVSICFLSTQIKPPLTQCVLFFQIYSNISRNVNVNSHSAQPCTVFDLLSIVRLYSCLVGLPTPSYSPSAESTKWILFTHVQERKAFLLSPSRVVAFQLPITSRYDTTDFRHLAHSIYCRLQSYCNFKWTGIWHLYLRFVANLLKRTCHRQVVYSVASNT